MDNSDFLHPVYAWYNKNKRELPWRQTQEPYNIWVSEIILQQTRVAQGIGYYKRFIEAFPDSLTLASATEEEVLKQWQGLGYYSRARNLHHAAKEIQHKYSGKFPDNYNSIAGLKGIGEYTAAAIASIAFGLPFAAVDGNVIRFISRYFEIGLSGTEQHLKTCRQLANEILNVKNPGDHNQALMELGAVICLPANPKCNLCPVADSCLALSHQTIGLLPPKKKHTPIKLRYFYYFLIDDSDAVYLQKRTGDDIWKNLYELPLIERPHESDIKDILQSPELLKITGCSEINFLKSEGPYTHLLSHRKIIASFIHLQVKDRVQPMKEPIIRVNKKDIHKFALPRLVEKYLAKSGI
jgi:A/G-specific adenine glycosylase